LPDSHIRSSPNNGHQRPARHVGKSATSEPPLICPKANLAHPAGLAYRLPDNQEVATVTPSEALRHIRTLMEASAELKDDTQRKVLLRGVVVVAQKGLGVARMGWPNASLTS